MIRTAHELNVYFQNVNSWHNKATTLKEIYRIYDPDVILLADTSQLPNSRPIKFFPYKVFSLNTANLHSGVAIMEKPYISFVPINHKFMSDTLGIKIETLTGPINILVNYTPHLDLAYHGGT